MPNGKVKFNAFFHVSAFEADIDEVQEGDCVSYELEMSKRSGKLAAARVKVIE